jgi:hypothetical protein
MMQYLTYENPAHAACLAEINENWPFQFSTAWSRFLREYAREQLVIVYNESLQAFMPLRLYHTSVFRLGQIQHAPMSQGKELIQRKQLLFFNLLIRDLRQRNFCDRLVQPHPYCLLLAVPPHARHCEFGTYVMQLSQHSAEEIFARMHEKYQKAIRHARKHGAVVRWGWQYFDLFYPILKSTLDRAGVPLESREYFLALKEYLGEKHTTVAMVFENDIPIGGTFYFYSKYSAFCTHAGSHHTKLYGAMKLLHYEMMLHFKSLQVQYYDLVGVRLQKVDPALEGIFRFKKGFGADLKTGYLWKTDIHPGKAKIFDWLQKIRGREWLCRDIIDQVTI